MCVTGGEPLAQPNCLPLLTRCATPGHEVSLETSGALTSVGVDPRVRARRGREDAGSGEARAICWRISTASMRSDQVKFVICDRGDYEWAARWSRSAPCSSVPRCCSRPATSSCAARQLADWILADRLPVRLQVQLHKVLWGDEPGR